MISSTLWDLAPGERQLVGGFSDRLDDRYRLRLIELGFHVGESVTCVQAPKLGAPKLYRIHNAIYSLDDHIAMLINVEQRAVNE